MKSTNITVSIIVPVYNVKKYLSRCLNSLVNQTLENIEIICVNDASTDDSLTILKNYQNTYPQKLKVIDLPVNKKQGGARNAGLEIAQGDYIGFVDSDDWVDLHMYEDMYQLAISSDREVVDCNYVETDNGFIHKEMISLETHLCTDNLNKKELLFNYGRLVTKLFKRHFFDIKGYNLRFPENMFYEDNYLGMILAVKTNSIAKLEKNYYFYFQNETSTTRQIIDKNDKRLFDRITSADLMLNYFKNMDTDNFQRYKNEIEARYMSLAIRTTFHMAVNFSNNYPKELMNVIHQSFSQIDWKSNNREKSRGKKYYHRYKMIYSYPLLTFKILRAKKIYKRFIKDIKLKIHK